MTRIGVLAPIELCALRDYLRPREVNDRVSEIYGAPPVNLLCRELLKRGRDLVVFSLHPSLDREYVLEGERLRIHLGPIKNSSVVNAFREERRFLTRAIRLEQPALLHAHWTYEYALAAIDSGLPHVVTAHDAPLAYLRWNAVTNPFEAHNTQGLRGVARNNAFWLARTVVAYRATRAAQRVVAVSPYVADHLRRYGFYDKPIEVIPNGMPSEVFEQRLRGAADGPIVFATALGGWGRLKNGAAAIQAFAKVSKIVPGVRLLMFGGGFGPDGPAATWARKKGLSSGIDFRGHVSHAEMMDNFARLVDVLVHPSMVEAHPMPLIEAMSLGVPVIAGRAAGGAPWTLGEGKHGVLVDVGSANAIAAAMLQLAEDREARAKLGASAREFARQRFALEPVANRYEAIYADLITRTQIPCGPNPTPLPPSACVEPR